MSGREHDEAEAAGDQPGPLGLPSSDAPLDEEQGDVHAHLDAVFGRLTLLIAVASAVSGIALCGGLIALPGLPLTPFASPSIAAIATGWTLAVGLLPTLPICCAVWMGLSALAGRARRPLADCFSPHALGVSSVLACLACVGMRLGVVVVAAITMEALLLVRQRDQWRLAAVGEGRAPPRWRFSLASLIALTVIGAGVSAVIRLLPGSDGAFSFFAWALLTVVYETALAFVATLLFLVLGRPAWGWLFVVAAALLPGWLLYRLASPQAPLSPIVIAAFLPHGVALGSLLHCARRSGVHVVERSPCSRPSDA